MIPTERHALNAAFPLEHHYELGRFLHLHALLQRRHRHVVVRELRRHAPDTVLPDRAVVLHTVQDGVDRRVLADVGEALVLLETWKSDAHVVVSADDEGSAAAIADEIKARMPVESDEQRVVVTFSDAMTGPRTMPLDVHAWLDVREHYPDDVRRSLDVLVAHAPDVGSARRLILWHGVPGTGKTSAVRALLHAWRGWAEAVVITDPDTLLKDGKYLRRVLLDTDDEEDERWKLFVMEDAEALLRKETGGSAMGKLLNLADGLLGQGLRCLFLITSNESLGAIHPAIVRPGRCLAQLEFQPMPSTQAARLLGRPVDRAMTLAEVMAATPVQTRSRPVAVGQYL